MLTDLSNQKHPQRRRPSFEHYRDNERNNGAQAVQGVAYSTSFFQQNPIATIQQLIYTHAHNGWIVLSGMEFPLPHNPSVPGSSPGCPTFLFGFIRLKMSWLQQSIQISLKRGSHPWTICGPLAYNNWR